MKRSEIENKVQYNSWERKRGKRLKIVMKKKHYKMVCASFYIPKATTLKPLGEDSHFISADQQTIGVADGVGGWAKYGVDSGEYARKLMRNTVTAVNVKVKGSESVDPRRVIGEAFSKTRKLKGSSTACIVTHSDGVLRAANVGDSGFMVFREGKLLYKSPTQQRRFNHPFQLGNDTEADRPECAVESAVSARAGDIVVLTTDGLLDNVFEWELEDVIASEGDALKRQEELVLSDLAWKIAKMAYCKSLDDHCYSPFARFCRLLGRDHKGGKMDDITAVVGHIVNDKS